MSPQKNQHSRNQAPTADSFEEFPLIEKSTCEDDISLHSKASRRHSTSTKTLQFVEAPWIDDSNDDNLFTPTQPFPSNNAHGDENSNKPQKQPFGGLGARVKIKARRKHTKSVDLTSETRRRGLETAPKRKGEQRNFKQISEFNHHEEKQIECFMKTEVEENTTIVDQQSQQQNIPTDIVTIKDEEQKIKEHIERFLQNEFQEGKKIVRIPDIDVKLGSATSSLQHDRLFDNSINKNMKDLSLHTPRRILVGERRCGKRAESPAMMSPLITSPNAMSTRITKSMAPSSNYQNYSKSAKSKNTTKHKSNRKFENLAMATAAMATPTLPKKSSQSRKTISKKTTEATTSVDEATRLLSSSEDYTPSISSPNRFLLHQTSLEANISEETVPTFPLSKNNEDLKNRKSLSSVSKHFVTTKTYSIQEKLKRFELDTNNKITTDISNTFMKPRVHKSSENTIRHKSQNPDHRTTKPSHQLSYLQRINSGLKLLETRRLKIKRKQQEQQKQKIAFKLQQTLTTGNSSSISETPSECKKCLKRTHSIESLSGINDSTKPSLHFKGGTECTIPSARGSSILSFKPFPNESLQLFKLGEKRKLDVPMMVKSKENPVETKNKQTSNNKSNKEDVDTDDSDNGIDTFVENFFSVFNEFYAT